MLLAVCLALYSYLLERLNLRALHYFVFGLLLCLLSSVMYASKSMMNFSSILLATILALAVVSAHSLIYKKKLTVLVPAFVVGLLFPRYGNTLTYSFVYPLLSKLQYAGVMYTALGMAGIFIQAFLESLAITFCCFIIFHIIK